MKSLLEKENINENKIERFELNNNNIYRTDTKGSDFSKKK